jgi:Tol biopolymer transport system component/DNA-binding winged helix-turn-helix (wHTH) protein
MTDPAIGARAKPVSAAPFFPRNSSGGPKPRAEVLESGLVNADLPKTSRKRERPFRLGDLEIRPASNEIRGQRGVERLRPLLMDVLLRLAAQPGEVVRRETLLEDVWPRRMVNDEVLSRAIAELRTALGDDARVARFIETIPKTGYRLVAPIAELEGSAPPSAVRRPGRLAAVALAGIAVVALAAGGGLYLTARPAAPPDADLEKLLANARPLTSDPALELAPRFSPDGRRVAFVQGEGARSRIFVQEIDGSSRVAVTPAEGLAHSPVFFPDGERLAFWKRAGADCGIFEIVIATGAERRLVDCALEPRARFDLSRDGRHLVFTGNTRPQYPAGLWIATLGDAAPRALTAPDPGMGDDLLPRFSPDGTRIAFFRGNESHRQPWIVGRDDKASARVAGSVEGLSYGVAWLGNDGPLLAAADWLGFRALNVLDLATGRARIVGARGARFPDVSAAGDVVYENAIYAANLWRVETARGAEGARALWRSTRYTSQPEFSPDGKLVAFSSNREGTDAIYVAAPDGEPRKVLWSETYRYLRPQWSADSRAVYAVRTAAGRDSAPVQHAVRVAVDGGAEEVLRALGNSVNAVLETRDGRWLYVGEIAGNAMRMLRAPLQRPEALERLPLPLVTQVGINATHLVFSQPQLTALTACRLATLACEPLGVDVAEADVFHWSLGDRSLFLRRREGAGATLARYDLAARRFAADIGFAPSGAGTSIAASPDESVLLVAREEGPAIDLMVARR